MVAHIRSGDNRSEEAPCSLEIMAVKAFWKKAVKLSEEGDQRDPWC